jgi:pseudaminic acid synthase
MSKTFKINGRSIGTGEVPFIIAEMSGNHNQSIDRALAIVEAAAAAGAHGLKLQTYTADTMTLNLSHGEFFIADPNSLWEGRSLYDLYQEAHTPWEWHKPIFNRAYELGMIPFSTPFDATAVDFLESLEVPCYKIASFEIIDLPLIKRVAQTGKPMIMSTGMASIAEIDDAVRTARENGCQDLVLLKCTSNYPASPENSNLMTLPHLRDLFDVQVGLSDHTMGIGAAIASVALGATVIEKHFTLDRSEGGVDSAFSLEPAELKQLVIETDRAALALGKVSYGPTEAEKSSLQYRRSLYITKDLKEGDILTEKNVRSIRPGYGISPKYYDRVLNTSAKFSAPAGTPLKWEFMQSKQQLKS